MGTPYLAEGLDDGADALVLAVEEGLAQFVGALHRDQARHLGQRVDVAFLQEPLVDHRLLGGQHLALRLEQHAGDPRLICAGSAGGPARSAPAARHRPTACRRARSPRRRPASTGTKTARRRQGSSSGWPSGVTISPSGIGLEMPGPGQPLALRGLDQKEPVALDRQIERAAGLRQSRPASG
jgi:hypothetical protein